MNNIFRYLLLFCVVVASAAAQRTPAPSVTDLYAYGDDYFLEVTTHPGSVPMKGRAIVAFRLTYDLLNFRKSPQAYRREEGIYSATPTVFIEAVGSDGVIADRATWRDTVRTSEYATTNSKLDFAIGAVSLALRPGVYTVRYTFNDGAPDGGFTESTKPFKMDDFNSPSPAIGLPMFLRSISGDTLTALGIDGNALYGRRLRIYLPLASADPPAALRYELYKTGKGGVAEGTHLSGQGRMLGLVRLGEPVIAGNELRFILQRSDAATAPTGGPRPGYAALVDAPSGEMEIGDYLLLATYEAGGSTVTDSIRFQHRWVDMPLTLSKTDYAIKALYPIATDETIDTLLSGDPNEQAVALERFWSRRDPTPETRFNEAMAEYYRRVDYALFNFRTIGQRDGAHTDRGKIYLLYGSPTEINRTMQQEGPPREIWTYRNQVAQEFVFLDESRTGEYRLVEYHNL